MTPIASNNRQRKEDEGKDFGKTVVLFVLILLLLSLTACSTLNDHVAACYDAGGRPSYTSHNGFSGSTKFDCK